MRPSLGVMYVPSLNFKPVVSRFEEGAFVGILLLYLCFSLSLLQFQLIFVSFVIISAILCCFFKAMLIVRILF